MESMRMRLSVTLPEESEKLLVGAQLRKLLKEAFLIDRWVRLKPQTKSHVNVIIRISFV